MLASNAGTRSVNTGGDDGRRGVRYYIQRRDPLGGLTDTLIFFSAQSVEVVEE